MTNKTPRPNFLFAGAPKCGTSSLFEYLKQHPDVFMPKRKEIHYFGSDVLAPGFPTVESEYLKFFEDAGEAKRIGEAAIWYYWSKDAAEEIKAFDPNMKMVVMLRDPRDMIYSYHSQRMYNGNEKIRDFAEALAAISDRKQGRRLPRDPHPEHALDYRSLGFYHDGVKRLFDVLGRENVHVIIFNDFKEDTRGSYLKVLDFLGLDKTHEPTYEVVNKSKRIRSGLLRGIVYGPPALLYVIVRVLLPFKSWRHKLKKFVVDANTVVRRRAPMSEATKLELTNAYRDDVRKLGELLDRDLVKLWRFE